MENLTFKLYSPLTAELLPVDSEFCQEDELVELRGQELSAYLYHRRARRLRPNPLRRAARAVHQCVPDRHQSVQADDDQTR